MHKEGLQLMQANYTSQAQAKAKIASGLEDFYRTKCPDVWASKHGQVEQAARTLVAIYSRNVFPSMKVTWGTYPDNIGHMDYPGCFRCHDGKSCGPGRRNNQQRLRPVPQHPGLPGDQSQGPERSWTDRQCHGDSIERWGVRSPAGRQSTL